MKPKPGDKITIKVNGKKVKTIIDVYGTQRMPYNKVIAYLLHSHPSFDYEELANLTQMDMFTQDERRFIYQNNGYSVTGYAEVFPDDVIENPLWEDDNGE